MRVLLFRTTRPLVRLLRSAAPSRPKLASMATSRCTTPTPTSSAWVTPACGRSPSCLVPFTFSWLRWPCPSSLRWSHLVRGAERAWEGLLKHSSSECDSQQRDEMDPQPSDLIPVSVWIRLSHVAVTLFFPCLFGSAAHMRGHSLVLVVRTILMVILGLYSQYWLLIHVSGFQSLLTALLCMLVCRAMFSVPYIHVNIFQVKTFESESTKKTPQ